MEEDIDIFFRRVDKEVHTNPLVNAIRGRPEHDLRIACFKIEVRILFYRILHFRALRYDAKSTQSFIFQPGKRLIVFFVDCKRVVRAKMWAVRVIFVVEIHQP